MLSNISAPQKLTVFKSVFETVFTMHTSHIDTQSMALLGHHMAYRSIESMFPTCLALCGK